MTSAPVAYRWTRDGFLRAWEAGAFEGRVELIEGEVWPVVIGKWHGAAVARVIGSLSVLGVGQATTATLPCGDSLPDPDCWVLNPDAVPAGHLSQRIPFWDPTDVWLVVEVSDDSVMQDLTIKTRIYALAGCPVYWVITDGAVYVHTEPHGPGYRNRTEYRPGDRVPVPYAEATIAVDDLIGTPARPADDA